MVEFEFHVPVPPSQLLSMSLWIWLAMDVGNLEVFPFSVHDHVLYLPVCSCQCSHLSQRQSVVILSALLFENHRKQPDRPQGSNLLRALLEKPDPWSP